LILIRCVIGALVNICLLLDHKIVRDYLVILPVFVAADEGCIGTERGIKDVGKRVEAKGQKYYRD